MLPSFAPTSLFSTSADSVVTTRLGDGAANDAEIKVNVKMQNSFQRFLKSKYYWNNLLFTLSIFHNCILKEYL